MGAERITEERKLPLLCLKQVDQLNCFSNAMNMYYIRLFIQAPLFHFKLCPTRGTLREHKRKIWANKNVTKKTKKSDRAVLFMSTQVLLWH